MSTVAKVVVEGALMGLGIVVVKKLIKKKNKGIEEYSDEDVDKALLNFTPQKLASHLTIPKDTLHVISCGRSDNRVQVELDPLYYGQEEDKDSLRPYIELGKRYDCLDFSSLDFLNMSTNERVLQHASNSLGKYGPGACGPRGFYGSLDIFIDLESHLAAFYGFESCALYSYEALVFPSVISTLLTKKGQDVLVPRITYKVMKGDKLMYEIQSVTPKSISIGFKLTKPIVHEVDISITQNIHQLDVVAVDYKVLEAMAKEYPNTWLFMECGSYGISLSVIKSIYEILRKFGSRLCIDCTSLLNAYAPVQTNPNGKIPCDVLLMGLATGFGGTGAAVLADKEIVERQRLGGRGYVFSAAPSPACIGGVEEALHVLEQDVDLELVNRARANTEELVSLLAKQDFCAIESYVEGSPVITISLRRDFRSGMALREVVEKLIERGILVSPVDYPTRRISICVKSKMQTRDLQELVGALRGI